MPSGCHFGRFKKRRYTVDYCRISAIAFKPLLKAKFGHYEFISDQLGDQHKRFQLIWADDDRALVQFTINQKIIRVHLVQDNSSASNKLYFVCPNCKTKRQHLYAVKSTYACRSCLGLHYPSQSERSNVRLRQKIRNKRKKVWGEDWPDVNNLFENSHCWPKPKGLHWKTFFKAQDELVQLEIQYWPSARVNLDTMLKRLDT